MEMEEQCLTVERVKGFYERTRETFDRRLDRALAGARLLTDQIVLSQECSPRGGWSGLGRSDPHRDSRVTAAHGAVGELRERIAHL